MQTYRLIPHPGGGAPRLEIACSIEHSAPSGVDLTFSVEGDIESVRWPVPAAAKCTDQLWLNTCFEMFAMGGDPQFGYDELNLSPSGAWASFGFTSYRSGQDHLRTVPPDIRVRRTDQRFELTAFGVLPPLAPWRIGLSAVIEEIDGTKSYWALAHAPGPPDFHNPACFTATLPPPASK